jgi:hypothetical protein
MVRALILQHVPICRDAGVNKCGKLAPNFCFSAPFIGPLNSKVGRKDDSRQHSYTGVPWYHRW